MLDTLKARRVMPALGGFEVLIWLSYKGDG